MRALDNALADLEAGRPWMARDRLHGTNPWGTGNAEVFDLLGRVHAAMNDQPAAGLAWFLSDRSGDDPEIAAALEVMRQRYKNPVAVAIGLDLRAPISKFPPAAQQRLRDLQTEIEADHGKWNPPGLPQDARRRFSRNSPPDPQPTSRQQLLKDRLEEAAIGAGLVTILVVFLVGIVESVQFVVRLLGQLV